MTYAAKVNGRHWTRAAIVTGNKDRGFTLIELMVVLLLISILAGVIAPMVVNSLDKARESALKEDLYILRKTLDDYYADKGAYPESLELLVEEGYLRSVVRDPFTERTDSWQLTRDDEGGISDVHSGSEGVARDGSSMREW